MSAHYSRLSSFWFDELVSGQSTFIGRARSSFLRKEFVSECKNWYCRGIVQLGGKTSQAPGAHCTRKSPLPLLPSGPGGVGGSTSRETDA